MLQFTQGDHSAEIILTLTELVTINDPYYLFVFTHVTTKDVVAFVLGEADDQSNYPERYNKFIIDVADLFDGKSTGEWHYAVYQQSDPINIDPEISEGLLEYGKLILESSTSFEYTIYDTATTYKAYNG